MTFLPLADEQALNLRFVSASTDQQNYGSVWILLSRTRESCPEKQFAKFAKHRPSFLQYPFVYQQTENKELKELLGSFRNRPSFLIAEDGLRLLQRLRN